MKRFDPKDPGEFFPLTFNFRPYIERQAIASVAVTAEVFTGTDPAPINILSGAPVTDSGIVRQAVTGGLEGVTYLIRATVTTAAGYRYTLGALLPLQKAGTW